MSEWKPSEYNTENLFYIDDELHCDEEAAIAEMLLSNNMFISEGTDIHTGEYCVSVFLNCSDTFSWGCSDAEPFRYSEVLPIYVEYIKDKVWGTTRWVCIKRNQKPQRAVEVKMREAGVWDDIMESLPDNQYEILMAKHAESVEAFQKTNSEIE